MKNNKDILDLVCKTNDIDNVHDYQILTNVDYKIKCGYKNN